MREAEVLSLRSCNKPGIKGIDPAKFLKVVVIKLT